MVQNLRERENLGDVWVEGRIILKSILKKNYEIRTQFHLIQDNRLLTGFYEEDHDLSWTILFLKGPSLFVSSNIQYISTFKTQHMQGPDVYYDCVIPGDMFRSLNGHLQANIYYYITICWPEDGRLTAETCRQV